MAQDRGGGGDLRRHEVGAAALALAAFEVAVGGGRGALTGGQLVGVHAQAHGAAGVPPFGSGLLEDLVQALVDGLETDAGGAGDDQHPQAVGDPPAAQDVGGGPQVLDAAVRAGADEDGVHLDVAQRLPGRESHVPRAFSAARRSEASSYEAGSGTCAERARPGRGWCPR